MAEFDELQQTRSANPKHSTSKAPAPKPTPLGPETRLKTDLVRAALQTAQHWFDRGLASLDSKHGLDWRVIAEHASTHLYQAVGLVGGVSLPEEAWAQVRRATVQPSDVKGG